MRKSLLKKIRKEFGASWVSRTVSEISSKITLKESEQEELRWILSDMENFLKSGVSFVKQDAVITTSYEAKRFLKFLLKDKEREVFVALYLNAQGRVIHHTTQEGTVDKVGVYPREIARLALENNILSVIVAHNHPSGGKVVPSEADKNITLIIRRGLRLFDIELLDHFIYGEELVSLRELNLTCFSV